MRADLNALWFVCPGVSGLRSSRLSFDHVILLDPEAGAGGVSQSPTRLDAIGERDAIAGISTDEKPGRVGLEGGERVLVSLVIERVLRDRAGPAFHVHVRRLTVYAEEP